MMTARKEVKLPKQIFIQEPADFAKFEETLRTLCEKFLSHDWDWTFRVGGQVQREIEKNDPHNPDLHIILGRKNFEEGPFTLIRPSKREIFTGDREEKYTRTPPPPPPHPGVSRGVANAMGKRGWEIERLKKEEDERFFNIHKHEFEDSELLSVRKEIWDWTVSCVQGEEKNLFCAHLVREVDKWDIHQLYRQVRDFLNTENYKEYGQRLERYFTAQPKNGEDIFTYMSRLDKYREEIEHLQHLATEAGETLVMPKFYRVWKILSAVEKFSEYRIFTDKIQQVSPNEWIKLTPEMIRHELHKIHSNKVSLHQDKEKSVGGTGVGEVGFMVRKPPPPPSSSRSPSSSRASSVVREGRGSTYTPNTNTPRADTPGRYPITDQLRHFNCPEGVCLGHFRFGRCPRAQKGKPCHFLHTHTIAKENTNTNVGRSRSVSPVPPSHPHSPSQTQTHTHSTSYTHNPRPSHIGGVQNGGVKGDSTCSRCGYIHGSVCLWDKRCYVCGGLHAARVCRKNQTTTVTFGSQGRERRNSV